MARRGAPRKDYITDEDLNILAHLLAGDRPRKAKTELAKSIAARERDNGNPVTVEAARKLLDLRWREQQQAIKEQASKPARTLVAVPRSPIWGGFSITDLAVDPMNDPRIGTAWERLEAHANRRTDPSTAFGRLTMAGGEFDAAQFLAMQRAREQYETPALRDAQERLEHLSDPLRDAQVQYENSAMGQMQRDLNERVERALWGAPDSVMRQDHERWLREQEALNRLDPFRHLRRHY